jgi:hypothetical protein
LREDRCAELRRPRPEHESHGQLALTIRHELAHDAVGAQQHHANADNREQREDEHPQPRQGVGLTHEILEPRRSTGSEARIRLAKRTTNGIERCTYVGGA